MLENNNTGHEPEYLAIFMCTILACLGGIVKELSNFESCFNKRRFFSNIIVSAFAGLVVGLFCEDFEHKTLILSFAGISGTIGASLVNYLGDLLLVILHHMASVLVGHKITKKDIELAKSIRKSSRTKKIK